VGLLLLTSCNPRRLHAAIFLYTQLHFDRDLPRSHPCGDVNCAASAPQSSPQISTLQLRLGPSTSAFATHPLGDACLRIQTLQPSINGPTPSFRLPCSSPLFTPSFGDLQKPGFIPAESDLQLDIANRSEDSCSTQVEGTVGAREALLYFWCLFLRSLPRATRSRVVWMLR
jgi:hypothetical protein